VRRGREATISQKTLNREITGNLLKDGFHGRHLDRDTGMLGFDHLNGGIEVLNGGFSR
jgi:hypothetical protein